MAAKIKGKLKTSSSVHISELLAAGNSSKECSAHVGKKMLEYAADEADNIILKNLLTALILQYSISEKKLTELNQLKNKFLGIAAHDLRNPLSAIRGFSEILISEATGPLNDQQKEFLKIINTSSNGMLKLLNDLLDISAIESGKLDLKIKPGSVKELLEDRLQLNRVVAQSKDITLQSSLEDIQEGLFDYGRMAQVVDNLISNAIKFSPIGSNVYIELSQDGNRALVTVRDEGPGFAVGDEGRLFGEFQKLSAKPTAGEKSTGLGLSIVKKIVESHKGMITASNAPEKGAIFSFTIPLNAGG